MLEVTCLGALCRPRVELRRASRCTALRTRPRAPATVRGSNNGHVCSATLGGNNETEYASKTGEGTASNASLRLDRRTALGTFASLTCAMSFTPGACAADASNGDSTPLVTTSLEMHSSLPPNENRKTVLVIGATGRVGSAVTRALLNKGHDVRVIVRDASRLPAELLGYIKEESSNTDNNETPRLTPIVADVSRMSIDALASAMKGCDAIVSCLGHRITKEGIVGEPRFLVTDTVKLVWKAAETIQAMDNEFTETNIVEHTEDSVKEAIAERFAARNVNKRPTRFVLLASAGVHNPSGGDPQRSLPESLTLKALAKLLPPFADTVSSVEFLASSQMNNSDPEILQWCVVRPDDFLDVDVTPTETNWALYETLQNGLFKPGVSSVVNIGESMASLAVCDEKRWAQWEGKMPQMLDESVK